MFTTGSKYFIALSVLSSIALAVYLIFVGPSSIGGTALFGMIAATGLLAGLALSTRDGDTETAVGAQAAMTAPSSSMWPLVSVLGAVVILLGTITTPIVFILGIVVVLAAIVEWVIQAWSERASGDATYNDQVRKRILNPLEYPVLATVGLGVIIFSFSRVMLAIDKSAGAVGFIVVASLVLLAGILFSVRPNLKRSLVTGICVFGALGLVSSGIAGMGSGLREDLAKAAEEDHYSHRECGPEKSEHGDKLPLESVSAKSSVIATIEYVDGKLIGMVQGIEGNQETLTIPRSNPSNLLFRNKTEGEFRLVAHLGERAVTEGVVEKIEVCTQLIPAGAEQLLTLTIPKPAADKPYTLEIAGVEGQSIEVVVP
ncbi:MAG: hypothetical protein ACO321_07565 [Ilumatobacteraceae bacterium]